MLIAVGSDSDFCTFEADFDCQVFVAFAFVELDVVALALAAAALLLFILFWDEEWDS